MTHEVKGYSQESFHSDDRLLLRKYYVYVQAYPG